MAPKRPVPLSDAAVGHKAASGSHDSSELAQDSYETSAGETLPVKNTFIDVPSGFSPTSSPSKKAQLVSTAPAQVHFQPGFVKRAVLESVEEMAPVTQDSPKKYPSVAVQRPGHASSSTPQEMPLMTPSPTGSSMFSAARYHLFGGPTPVQEATHSAILPGFAAAAGTSAAPHDRFAHFGGPALTGLPPNQVPCAAHPPPAMHSQVIGGSPPLSYSPPPPHLAAAAAVPPGMQCNASAAAPWRDNTSARAQKAKDEDADSDADSEAERQQAALAASGRTPENAPKPPPGAAHPSLGSGSHEEGTCKRCCFYPRNRCLNGYECEFCHYEHEKRKRKNKKSKKKKGADYGDDGYGAVDGMTTMPGFHAHAGAHHSLHAQLPPYQGCVAPPPGNCDPTLTFQWTDGIPGQTQPPAPMLGYADYLAAVLSRPPISREPVLATQGPPPLPPAPYYDAGFHPPPGGFPAYDHLQHPVHTYPGPHPSHTFHGTMPEPAHPASEFAGPAPPPMGVPRLPQELHHLGMGDLGPPHVPPPQPNPAELLGTIPPPGTEQPTGPRLPIEKMQAGTQTERPNMPPPEASPKLCNDLIESLRQVPPQPDESPT
eukprot:TRINITY_DN102940_c0_g1_i1.p1 TRINITY_DN102940_c0_g1~~TRINITY_DN102940_c0_g1_i1.p1  ORF type:complete len:611 (-),score=83.37 TRINITY_DN102940_c0_g1_i1:315-2111(-)